MLLVQFGLFDLAVYEKIMKILYEKTMDGQQQPSNDKGSRGLWLGYM